MAQGPGNFNKLLVTKVLRSSLVDDETFRAMFLDEARLAARMNHPNIPQTYEVGESEGHHFLTMEYLEGQPLHRVTTKLKETFPLEHRVQVIAQVLAGLHYAHELTDYDGQPLGVVHRDISPHNVFVTYDGQVKLMDFGIAKTANASTQTATGDQREDFVHGAGARARAAGRSTDGRVFGRRDAVGSADEPADERGRRIGSGDAAEARDQGGGEPADGESRCAASAGGHLYARGRVRGEGSVRHGGGISGSARRLAGDERAAGEGARSREDGDRCVRGAAAASAAGDREAAQRGEGVGVEPDAGRSGARHDGLAVGSFGQRRSGELVAVAIGRRSGRDEDARRASGQDVDREDRGAGDDSGRGDRSPGGRGAARQRAFSYKWTNVDSERFDGGQSRDAGCARRRRLGRVRWNGGHRTRREHRAGRGGCTERFFGCVG